MVKLYVKLIQLGVKTLDDVPKTIRSKVKEALEND